MSNLILPSKSGFWSPPSNRPGSRRSSVETKTGSARPCDVTVVIPVYNGAGYIASAVRSVFRQTIVPREVIVVDDGSTDETLQVLRQFGGRIRVLRQSNKGHCHARNQAIARSSGSWIAMLDADDHWEPEKLEAQLSVASDVDVVYTAVRNLDESRRVNPIGHVVSEGGAESLMFRLLSENFLTHSSVMFRRDVFEATGGYDTTLKTSGDWDLWLRMALNGSRFYGHPSALTWYRWRSGSISRDFLRTGADRIRVAEKTMERIPESELSWLQRRQIRANVWRTSAWFASESDDWTALKWNLYSLTHFPLSISCVQGVLKNCAALCGLRKSG